MRRKPKTQPLLDPKAGTCKICGCTDGKPCCYVPNIDGPTIHQRSARNRSACGEQGRTDDNGRLRADSSEMHVSLGTSDQIIATTVGGACEIGDQIVVDITNKAVMRRRYPTKTPDKICEAFSHNDTYVLHGGFWRLTPMVAKTFVEGTL